MAYDEGVAQRLREALEDENGIVEKKMFGGIAFMQSGNMCCGVVGDELMLRVGPDAYEELLEKPHARPMDFTGKPLKGMLYVGTPGFESDGDLQTWIARATRFTKSLPAK